MNKVISVNLNGIAYQLEEGGYEALRVYLETAARRLKGNPDRDEILADIEQAIADKFSALLGACKTVVGTKEIEGVIAGMGPVQDSSEPPAGGSADAVADEPGSRNAPAGPGTPPPLPRTRRLYRIKDGGRIGGVCNGLAAYFDIDVTLVRLLFVLAGLPLHLLVLLAYLLMVIIVPVARTPEQVSAACGASPTADDFIRRAKAGYYEGMRTYGDRRAHREWKRKFKREMREWKRDFKRQTREPPRPGAGSWFVRSLLSVLCALLAFVALLAAASLIATGAFFGLLLPVGIPLWAGLLLLFIAYRLVTSPLRALRRALLWQGLCGSDSWASLACLGDTLVWLGFLALLVWLARHHSAGIREALVNLPHAIRQAAEAIRAWWADR